MLPCAVPHKALSSWPAGPRGGETALWGGDVTAHTGRAQAAAPVRDEVSLASSPGSFTHSTTLCRACRPGRGPSHREGYGAQKKTGLADTPRRALTCRPEPQPVTTGGREEPALCSGSHQPRTQAPDPSRRTLPTPSSRQPDALRAGAPGNAQRPQRHSRAEPQPGRAVGGPARAASPQGRAGCSGQTEHRRGSEAAVPGSPPGHTSRPGRACAPQRGLGTRAPPPSADHVLGLPPPSCPLAGAVPPR